jgi:isopropylmalate/homocitrate/citramalate synthase
MADLILHDVGLRDGLQIERSVVPTATKVAWAAQLITSGIDMIQLGPSCTARRCRRWPTPR